MMDTVLRQLLASGVQRQSLARIVAGIAFLGLALVLLIAALGILLAAAYLGLATQLAAWAAALATGGLALLAALLCLWLASRSAPAASDPASIATNVIREHPFGSAAAALAAGVMVGRDEHSIERAVELMLGR